MKPTLTLPRAMSLAVLGALLLNTPTQAGDSGHTTHLVRIAAGDSDIIEADISDLGLGESRSFVTESGRTVDILRVQEGIELYLDGELIEAGKLSAGLDDHLALHEEVLTVECEAEAESNCSALIEDLAQAQADDMKVIIARHHVDEICGQQGNCDRSVWIDKDGDVTIDVDNDAHREIDHEVIVIRKEIRADSE